ncbi:CDC50 family protein [Xylaria intraflava]|nr:CDC50 family protein [Xylaria intraflava]
MDSSQGSVHEPSPAEEKKTSRRPANTAFRQQRLKAWQPILTPKNVIWIFLVLGAFAAVVGGLLIYASRLVTFIELDYTDCASQASDDFVPMSANLVKTEWPTNAASNPPMWKKTENVNITYGSHNVQNLHNCSLLFEIPKNMSAPVRAYYRLDNFYQNHRRYAKSFFSDQLLDNSFTMANLMNSDCAPLAVRDIFNETTQSSKTYQIYPCGLIANSIFNDTIGRPERVGTDNNNVYNWDEHGIAWSADRDLYEPLKNPDYDNIAPPPDWDVRFPDRYTPENPPPNLKEDDHFISWMRTAALPSFYKPWAFGNETLVNGKYSISIVDNFNVTAYKGRKWLVITTTGALGGRNDLPGILWLALSGFFFAMTILFVIGNWVRPRKLGDHTLLSWNKVPPSSAAKGKGKAPAGPTIGMSTSRDV